VPGFRRLAPALAGLTFLFCAAQSAPAAKYAGEFLRLGMGARAWALGGAYVALSSDATSVYWNPANLTRRDRKDLMLSHSETFGALLNYDVAAFALPAGRSRGPLTVGFALMRLGGGGIQRTRLANSSLPISDSNRVLPDGETVGHGDWALFAGLGRRLSPKLDVGGTLKIIYRDVVDVSATGFGLDVGATYSPTPTLRGAVVVYDVTTTLLAYDNGHKESVYPRAAVGAAVMPVWEKFAFSLALDGVLEFEGRQTAAQFHHGDISLDVRWGAEVLYRKRLALRGGMNAERPTLGIGVQFGRFTVDGAWQSHDVFDDSYRFSLSHAW
jgi:hypothetical protein